MFTLTLKSVQMSINRCSFTAEGVNCWGAHKEQQFASAPCALHINDGKSSRAAGPRTVGSVVCACKHPHTHRHTHTHTHTSMCVCVYVSVENEHFNVNATGDLSIILWLTEQHLALLNLHTSPENTEMKLSIDTAVTSDGALPYRLIKAACFDLEEIILVLPTS